MHAVIRNLGPVREANINIKPLTVFIGQNNTGKTWTAYLLASAFSDFCFPRLLEDFNLGFISYPEVDEVSSSITKNGTALIDIIELQQSRGPQFLNDLARTASRSLGTFLGTEDSFFDGLELNLDPSDIMKEWSEGIINSASSWKIIVGPKGPEMLNIQKKKGERSIKFYVTGREDDSKSLPAGIEDFPQDAVLSLMIRSIYPRIFFFPPERISYSSLALSPPKIEDLRNRIDSGSFNQSYPIADLMSMIAGIRDRGNLKDREETAGNDLHVRRYLELATLLRTELLKGDLQLIQSDPVLKANRVLFQPTGANGKTVEIPATASLVKSLSPLYLYLTYVAMPGDLLVIDEPEMNLHPEAQAKIIELLAILVNSGIRIIVTTHSPYIVDHLVNIMEGAERERPDEAAEKFYLKTSEAFLSKDKVSVYLFEDGTAKNVLSEDGMIDWGTFGDVSEQVSKIYFQI
ncbi:MAG: AAA family ATPase [Methanotrichaceae archaeon]|nr:AAA family ATPase [Methanotrichaceae archaeon]